jgi:TPR repeat protein
MKKILILLLTVFLSVGPLSGQEINKLDTSKILTTKQFLAKAKKQKKLIPKGEFETVAEYKSKLPANPDRLMTYVDVYDSQVTNPWDEKGRKLNLKYDPEKELFEGSINRFAKPSLSILLGTKGAGSYAASNAMGASKIVSKVEMNWMDLVAADADSLINIPYSSGWVGDHSWRWSKGQGEIYKPDSLTDEIRAIRPDIDISLSFHVPRNIAKSLNMKWVIDARILGYKEEQDTQAATFSYPYEIKQNFTRVYFNYVEAYLHLINTSNGEILFTHKLWVDESLEPQYVIPNAIAKLTKSAEPLAGNKGDAEAQYKLGVIYETNEGVTADDVWAAKRSLRAGQYRLAAEQGIFKDDTQAAKWFRLAADQGLGPAQYKLGLMYQRGKGVTKDDTQAAKWFRLAADQGDSRAQFNLGVAYDNGQGVSEDDVQAIKWFRLAADQGLADAQYNIGFMYRQGQGVPKDDAQAVKWFRLAAEQNNAQAQNYLGFMYRNGRGVPQDYAEAAKWTRLAADQGYAEAQSNLGATYYNGEGVPQDDAQAVKWFRLAADQGYTEAQNNLGVMYYNGRGVPKNYIQAYMWFRLAADQGNNNGKNYKYVIETRLTSEQMIEAQLLALNWKPKKNR